MESKRKQQKKQVFEEDTEETTLVEGRNAVMELLKSGRAVDKVFYHAELSGRMAPIITLAKEKGAVVAPCGRGKLDAMSKTGAHQGVIASAAAREYVSVEDILKRAEQRQEKPLLVVLDGVTDPHNLGAVIRSAETAGAHGVIIPKHRAAGLTAVTAKASAGAIEYMPVARVTNLTDALKKLQKAGVWVFGADAGGDKALYDADLKDAAALVIGSEGEGLSHIVRETCDFIVSIPMRGQINSLNASAAAAVLLYEAVRQRL